MYKKKQWNQDMILVVESEKSLKVKFDELEKKLQEKEKELQDKEKELECRIIPPSTESKEQTIVQAMSQVRLKELESSGLKNHNKNLESLALKGNKRERIGKPNAKITNQE